jgi:hypothetical protein
MKMGYIISRIEIIAVKINQKQKCWVNLGCSALYLEL